MRNKIFLLLTLILSTSALQAQQSVNDYKYLIVPVRYDFQKSDDQFQVNSLTKFLFEKEGFTVFLSNEDFPDELKLNRCLALTARLNDKSKLFNTKMNFDLVDCDNNVLFSALEGVSKEKDYKAAYFACVRESFEGVKELNYAYQPKEKKDGQEKVESSVNDVSKTEPVTIQTNSNTTTVVPVATTSVAVNNSEDKTNTVEPVAEKEQVKPPSDVLYAQPNANGYQVVDASPKVVYMLLKTSKQDVFLLKDHSAIVYKAGEDWKVEYYEDEKLVVKKLNLKFF